MGIQLHSKIGQNVTLFVAGPSNVRGQLKVASTRGAPEKFGTLRRSATAKSLREYSLAQVTIARRAEKSERAAPRSDWFDSPGVQVAGMTALRQLKAAWERFTADEANLTEFLNASGKRR